MKRILMTLSSFIFAMGCESSSHNEENHSTQAVQHLIQSLTVLYADTDNMAGAVALIDMERELEMVWNRGQASTPSSLIPSITPKTGSFCPPVPEVMDSTISTDWDNCNIDDDILLDGFIEIESDHPDQIFTIGLNIDRPAGGGSEIINRVRLETTGADGFELTLGPGVVDGVLKVSRSNQGMAPITTVFVLFQVTDTDHSDCPTAGSITVWSFDEETATKVEFHETCGDVTVTEVPTPLIDV